MTIPINQVNPREILQLEIAEEKKLFQIGLPSNVVEEEPPEGYYPRRKSHVKGKFDQFNQIIEF